MDRDSGMSEPVRCRAAGLRLPFADLDQLCAHDCLAQLQQTPYSLSGSQSVVLVMAPFINKQLSSG